MENKREHKGISGEMIWKLSVRRLKNRLSDEAIRSQLDSFTLKEITETTALISVPADVSISILKNSHLEEFEEALSFAAGYKVEVNFVEKAKEKAKPAAKVKKKKNREEKKQNLWRGLIYACTGILLILTAIIGTIFFKNIQFNRNFRETFYQVGSSKVEHPFRVIQLSDLHDSAFGEGNKNLADRIVELQPDIVVMTGDMIEKEENKEGTVENALALCRELTPFVPVYYIYGNNETMYSFGIHMGLEEIDEYLGCSEGNRDVGLFRQKGENTLLDELEAAGVHVLWNEMDTIEVNGNQIDIYGVLTSNISAFWQYNEEQYNQFISEEPEHFKLMAVHEPYIFEVLKQRAWADLIMCGHTHGGSVRIPGIGGLYERRNGWLPERKSNAYISGKYDMLGNPLIVSNGIGNESYFRINNQPELVIIDVERY